MATRAEDVIRTIETARIDYAIWPTAGLVAQVGTIVLLLAHHEDWQDLVDTVVHEAVHLTYPDLPEAAVRATTRRLLRHRGVALSATRRACQVLWEVYRDLSKSS